MYPEVNPISITLTDFALVKARMIYYSRGSPLSQLVTTFDLSTRLKIPPSLKYTKPSHFAQQQNKRYLT